MARPDFTVQADRLDIEVEAGATHIEAFSWESGETIDVVDPVDLVGTNCTARLVVREQKNEGAAVIELTSDPGDGIELGPDGAITLEFSPARTLLLAQSGIAGAGFYDLEITFGAGDDIGRVKRLLEGKLIVDTGASSV